MPWSATATGRNRLNQSQDVVGQTIRLNGRPFTIVGVAPDGFQGTGITAADVWVPITMRPAITDESAAVFENARAAWLMIGARLKPGVSFERGASEVAAIGQALQQGTQDTPAAGACALFRPHSFLAIAASSRAS